MLADAVRADRDSPAFDYSAMDGYAVRSADLMRGSLPVVDESRIGRAPAALPDSPVAVRIATGAAIPRGADAVIKREDVVEIEDAAAAGGVSRIEIPQDSAAAIRAGANIRFRGENAREGDVVLQSGQVLSAAAVGTLAAVGEVSPRVHRAVRVAVISTGDELVAPSAIPGPHEVRDSNAAALAAALRSFAWINVGLVVHARDDEGVLTAVLRHAIEAHDAVILTGGVSMGHRDPVRAAVESTGARIIFHGLPQRPGKPMLAAVTPTGKPIFGLPGNPVSTLVTCTRIALPVLGSRAGITSWPAAPRVRLGNPDGKSIDLWWHRLVRITERGEAELLDVRGSGDLVAAGRSDGFVEIPSTNNPAFDHDIPLFPFYPWPA